MFYIARTNHSLSNKSTGPTAATSRTRNSTNKEFGQTDDQHDIREYTRQIRRQKKDDVDIAVKSDGVKLLRKLLQKL